MTSPLGISALCVDTKGDIRVANVSTSGSFIRHFPFKGFTAKGVPIYSGAAGGWTDTDFPDEGAKTNAWGMAARMDYDVERDILIAFFPASPRPSDLVLGRYNLGRYDHWSKGNRKATWKVPALSPLTDPDRFMYEVNLFPYHGYMGMQLVDDYFFMAYLFGEVHVIDIRSGKLVEILAHGPEVAGSSAWEDATMGLRGFKRSNGEYLIFTENSGWGGKNNLFRWRPPAMSAALPAPQAPAGIGARPGPLAGARLALSMQ